MDYVNQIGYNNCNSGRDEHCVRCKVTSAYFICDECKHNTLYCANCDGYIHSLPSKRHHQRKFIQDPINDNYLLLSSPSHSLEANQLKAINPNCSKSSYQVESTEAKPNYQMTISQNYINEIKDIFEKEKHDLVSKLNVLSQQSLHSASTLNERIDYLHSHIETMKKEHQKEIEQLLAESKAQKSQLINKQKEQIASLQEQRDQMEEVISSQAEKLKEYERLSATNKGALKDQLAKVTSRLDEALHDSSQMKLFYERRIADLTQIAGEDKNSLIKTYENSIHQLNEGYQKSKEKYLEVIQQREDDMREMMRSHKVESHELNSIIDKLQSSNETLNKDQNDLILLNDRLKQGLEKANETIERNNNEISNYTKEQKELKKQLYDIQQEYQELNVMNEKVNRLTYGKFKPQKKTPLQKKR